jgi:hypothetical protein
MIKGLIDKTLDPNSVPPIRLVVLDGKVYTLDNRRLYAFQQAGVDVPYKMATEKEIRDTWGDKFSTRNDGSSIYLRGQDGER